MSGYGTSRHQKNTVSKFFLNGKLLIIGNDLFYSIILNNSEQKKPQNSSKTFKIPTLRQPGAKLKPDTCQNDFSLCFSVFFSRFLIFRKKRRKVEQKG